MGIRIVPILILLIFGISGWVPGQTKPVKKTVPPKPKETIRMDTTTWKDLPVGNLSVREFEELPLFSVKVAPLGILDPINQMITFSGEIRPVSSNFAYGLEASLMRGNTMRNKDNPVQVGNGFVLRPYCRVYYQTEGKRTISFLDFMGFYKSMSIHYTDWLDFFPGSPTQSYSQEGTLHISRVSYGFMLLAGTLEYSGKGKKRTFMEYFGGIGLRNREIRYTSPGEGFAGLDERDLWPYNTTGWIPTIHIGIRMGFFGLPNF